MNRAFALYGACPLWMQTLMISAYGARLRWRRYGPAQRALLSELRNSQWLDAVRIRSVQLKKLQLTVEHAYANVPYYRSRIGGSPRISTLDDLQLIPVLTKDAVKSAGRALLSDRHHAGMLEIHTGGTTGKPMTVFCNRATLQRNYAFFARLREWAGIQPRARVATFAGRRVVPSQSNGPYWRHNLASRTLVFSSYHISPSTVDEYIEALARFRPDLIDSYPSSLAPLAARMLERGSTSVRPRAIITSSETLAPDARAELEAAFGCPVFDHYGSAEMTAFITMCHEGRYHENPEFGIIELLRDGRPVAAGETGEIVATGFINPVMPLLRYATGDSAVRGATGCACGRAFPVIERIEGRMDDIIMTPEGRRIGRLDPIFKSVASLYESRIVQDRIDHVRVEAVVDGELSAKEQGVLLEELQARLGPSMSVDFVRVPAIERTGGGKLRAVVNRVHHASADAASAPDV